MATRNKSFLMNPLTVVLLGCAMAFAVACGDDDDGGTETPAGGTKAMGGSGGSAGKNTGGSSTAGKNSPAGGDAPVETMGGSGGAGPDMTDGGAGGVPASCTDDADMGCFSCKPTTHEQFLNHCPTTGCEPFNNDDLTSLKDGALPDLP